MLKKIAISVICVSLFFVLADARIRYVPGEYSTIQEGINDCSGGDTLLVDPGTYFENITFNGQYLVLASTFLTTGNPDFINSTVIDGGGLGPVVRFENGEDSRAVITGFKITNGLSDDGGGIFCNNSSPVISKNLITQNETFYGLWPYGQGAGIFCDNSEATIINNQIIGNFANGTNGGRGGGIFCLDSAPDIINNTICGNEAVWFGGGICSINSNAVIANCILWGNVADEGTEIYFEGSAPQVTYSDVYAGWSGIGNINSNPEFRDRNAGDFRLMSTQYGYPYDSPCIDVGAPFIRDAVLDSLWGLGTILSDLGAFGGGNFELAGVEDEIPDYPELISVAGNYPNPFNSRTVIRFFLSRPGDISIEIFDLLGRRVESLSETRREAGEHNIVWDGDDKAAGVYFYKIKSDSFNISQKMLLLK
jgi:hypothetical protein